MLLKKKSFHKPLYKQFIRLRENIQDRKKILKFKKTKWLKLVQQYKRKLRRYKKFKPQDQTRYIASKFPSKGTSYKKRFRDSLNASRKFRLLYGGLSKSFVKKQIKYLFAKNKAKKGYTNWNLLFLQIFENRLDTILYKSKFSISLRNSRQLILHGKVLINKKKVKTPSYIVKPGDTISIDPKNYNLIEKNLKNVQTWLIPPKYLTINYRTLEIIVGDNKNINTSIHFPFNLNLEQVIVDYYRH